jgi:ferredoxin
VGRLVSVNVRIPKNVQWRDKTVYTGTASASSARITVWSARIHSELFGALPAINPGIVEPGERKPPHPPVGPPGTGPAITFARSGLTVSWSPRYRSILDLADACDVPTRFSCRSGVCHVCVTGIVAGTTAYVQRPLEPPVDGSVLICSAAPETDVVLDISPYAAIARCPPVACKMAPLT